MNKCSQCCELKDASDFSKNRAKKTGVNNWCKECEKEYRFINRDKKSVYMIVYRKEHQMEASARQKTWRASHLNNKRATESKRRATIAGVTLSEVPIDIWSTLLEFYGYKCMVPTCEATESLELDHIVAIVNGGFHTVDNFQILCKKHNCSKGNRHSTDYRPYPRLVA